MNPCAVPAMSTLEVERWLDIHNRFVNETREREPDVLFIGDSVTSQLEQRVVWKEMFMPMHALNFSIIGDMTQNILWRIQNGELDNIQPRVVVIYAGGNNHNYDAEQIADGLIKIVETVHEKQPEAFILVQSILPRGLSPNKARERNDSVNSIVKERLESSAYCKVVASGDGLVKADGTIDHLDMYDYFYPTNEGFRKAFKPLQDELESLLTKDTSLSFVAS